MVTPPGNVASKASSLPFVSLELIFKMTDSEDCNHYFVSSLSYLETVLDPKWGQCLKCDEDISLENYDLRINSDLIRSYYDNGQKKMYDVVCKVYELRDEDV